MTLRTLAAALAAGGTLLLSGCGSSEAPTAVGSPAVTTQAASPSLTTEAVSATTTSKPTTSKPTTSKTTTAASSSKGDPKLQAICDEHCPKLQAVYDLPPCHTNSECTDQDTAATMAVTGFVNDFLAAGFVSSHYPDLDSALDDYFDAADKWYDDPLCSPMVFDGSDRAVVCGIEFLTMKTTVGTIGLALDTASRT